MKQKYLVSSLFTFLIGISFVLPMETKADFDINVLDRTTLYDSPDIHSKTYGTLAPQGVKGITDAAEEILPLTQKPEFDRWYQINTYLGPKWITNKFSVAVRDITIDERKIGTLERKVLYDLPSRYSTTSGSIAPQIVNQISYIPSYLRHNSDWYQINTYLGPKWIEVSSQTSTYGIATVPKTSSRSAKIQLNDRTKIYTKLNRDSFYKDAYLFSQMGTLAPQTVNVIQYWGSFVQVKTYLGPMWLLFDAESMIYANYPEE